MTIDSTYAFKVLGETGIEVSSQQRKLLEEYTALLLHWNALVNLISRKDEAALWRNHILHSLAGLSVFDIAPSTRVLDVGTGGGLPGIPLAILRPNAEYVLMDSIAKKMRAVQNITDTLGLHHIGLRTSRVEQAAAHETGKFDTIVTRAVAPLEKLIAWCAPLAKPGARLFAWKGGDLSEEQQHARIAYPVCHITQHEFAFTGEGYFHTEGKCLVEVQF